MILAGRQINDGMGNYIVQQTVKNMVKTRRLLYGGLVNLLGLTFKGNFTGLYNSKVVDIIRE